MPQNDVSILERSARGASLLISLQIGSRALTFLVNQLLLRYLSPELLGISTQLELYTVTILTFARESLRIALGRQSGSSQASDLKTKGTTVDQKSSKKPLEHNTSDKIDQIEVRPAWFRTQEAVNLAYLAPTLSPIIALLFGYLYLNRASDEALQIPFIRLAVLACGIAAVLELFAEPCFAVVSQRGLFEVRARAETLATVSRCLTVCGLAAWGQQTAQQLGAMPFAAGQLCYAVVLNSIYWANMLPKSRSDHYTLWPQALDSRDRKSAKNEASERHLLSLFARPVLKLASTLYGQSVLKHFLTQGDAFLISFLVDNLSSQGNYALASNYGSLLARMLFQPIEESSRGVFGSLLGAATTSSKSFLKPKREQVLAARDYLNTVLRFYALLSTAIVAVGATIAPQALQFVAGKKWANSSAGQVLGVYCYYLPLLAFNGILEAFVAATATPEQLRIQSLWMAGFSVVFASAAYISVRIYELGAVGLVLANAINMLIRVLWSRAFVVAYFKRNETAFSLYRMLPRIEVIIGAILTNLSFSWAKTNSNSELVDLFQSMTIAGVFGLSLLFLEREYFRSILRLLRPSAEARKPDGTKETTAADGHL